MTPKRRFIKINVKHKNVYNNKKNLIDLKVFNILANCFKLIIRVHIFVNNINEYFLQSQLDLRFLIKFYQSRPRIGLFYTIVDQFGA
jgi:hypothetical protein